MANLGCTVHAYDPSVDQPPEVTHPNIHFKKMGIGFANFKTEEGFKIKSLDEFFIENNDMGKEITYLKLDVEGFELESLGPMIAQGLLDNVKQLGIEMHTGIAS